MNYKIAPTYYTRLLRVKANIMPGETLLNAGCGTGEYNYYLKDHFRKSHGIDINEEDIRTARSLNQDPDIRYDTGDITALEFPDGYFDSIICIDVLEHVDQPEQVLRELSRVLKPGGQLIASIPHKNYPFFYDPINFVMERLFDRHLPIGIWGFGHTVLFDREMLSDLLEGAGFSVTKTELLTHSFCGFLEGYVPSILQPMFKSNAKNKETVGVKKSKERIWRFSYSIPGFFAGILKTLVRIDYRLGKNSPRSVGVLMNAVKPDTSPGQMD
jgi:SAM-dependent methyltransferase